MGGDEKKVLTLQKKKKRKNNKKKGNNKPKIPPVNGSEPTSNGNHDATLDFDLGPPNIDFHDQIGIFAWIVMFVALLCRWLAPPRQQFNPHPHNEFGEVESEISLESSIIQNSSTDYSHEFSEVKNVLVQPVAEVFAPPNELSNSPYVSLSSFHSAESIRFDGDGEHLLSKHFNDNSTDININLLLTISRDSIPRKGRYEKLRHGSTFSLPEEIMRESEEIREELLHHLDENGLIPIPSEEFEPHRISMALSSSVSYDYQSPTIIPDKAITSAVFSVDSIDIDSNLSEDGSFGECNTNSTVESFDTSSEVFGSDSYFDYCMDSSDQEDKNEPSTSIIIPLRRYLGFSCIYISMHHFSYYRDVENTTPNGTSQLKKSKTIDNNIPQGSATEPLSRSYPNFPQQPDEHVSRSPTIGSESAGHRSDSSADGEPIPQDEVLGSDDEEQEDPRDYKKGGYHPVSIGDVFSGRYHVIRKLGWGHFSTVWLCWDTNGKRFVAMKIVKSAEHYTEAALDEIKLLLAVRDADRNDAGCQKVVQLLDEFSVSGVNGTHVCMVFEVLGCNLLKLIIRSGYQGLPMEQVRKITKQILEGLRYMHEKCNIIHTDIKPENVLVTMSHEEVKVMAQHAVVATKMNLKLSGSAVSTAPSHVQKKVQENLTKSKKKKMKKKAKKQRELLETQLAQMEGLTVDASTIQEVLSSAPNSARGTTRPPAPALLRGSMGPVPRLLQSQLGDGEQAIFCNPTYHSVQDSEGLEATKVQEISDAEDGTGIDIHQVSFSIQSPAPIDRTSLSPRSDSELRNALAINQPFGFGDTPLSPSHPFSSQQLPPVLPTPAVGPNLNDPYANIEVKIADLGNACWTHHHFTEDIQTRQYRSLEVLIGAGYGPPADIWSTACMAFELATGDYLFEPHQGDNYSRDEDHLAHIFELLGSIPPSVYKKGQHWKEFFNKQGRLLHIHQLKPWPLLDVLRQKYDWPFEQARQFASFLIPMLAFDQDERVTAAQALEHDWLKPFGGKPPPADCPIEVLKEIYPDGNIPGGCENSFNPDSGKNEGIDDHERLSNGLTMRIHENADRVSAEV
uniref:non-specific serine/threonine protein kinase n=1 Tax=Heterorhabditis bacteriophora TaxID=37862 RepID=A0A1I7XSA1_HETBA